MIRRIEHIKNFGVYRDFYWPRNLTDFKQFNLIYGWNYSGKTTLSKVFRCFERKNLHPRSAVQIQWGPLQAVR
jgi:wobble nucleotide-excising tRNase